MQTEIRTSVAHANIAKRSYPRSMLHGLWIVSYAIGVTDFLLPFFLAPGVTSGGYFAEITAETSAGTCMVVLFVTGLQNLMSRVQVLLPLLIKKVPETQCLCGFAALFLFQKFCFPNIKKVHLRTFRYI